MNAINNTVCVPTQELSNTNRWGTFFPRFSKIQVVDYKKEIGRRLREARDDLGWTLEEVERRLGGKLRASRISNYEQGLRFPKPYEINVLAGLYKYPASYLGCLDGEGEMNAQEARLLRNFRALPENMRDEEARHVEVLALSYIKAVDPPKGEWTAPGKEKNEVHSDTAVSGRLQPRGRGRGRKSR